MTEDRAPQQAVAILRGVHDAEERSALVGAEGHGRGTLHGLRPDRVTPRRDERGQRERVGVAEHEARERLRAAPGRGKEKVQGHRARSRREEPFDRGGHGGRHLAERRGVALQRRVVDDGQHEPRIGRARARQPHPPVRGPRLPIRQPARSPQERRHHKRQHGDRGAQGDPAGRLALAPFPQASRPQGRAQADDEVGGGARPPRGVFR
jgi:hypothetical protein